jgi:hypothetical protein
MNGFTEGSVDFFKLAEIIHWLNRQVNNYQEFLPKKILDKLFF